MPCLTWGERRQDHSPLWLWLPDSLRESRTPLLLLPAACDYQVHTILVCEFVGNLQEWFTVTPPPLSDPSIPLSSCVTLCPWTDGMLRELGSYTIQHSVTLQWPVVCRPPWENGISTKPQPCDPASAELSESRSLCTALTRMSPHLFFFLSLKSLAVGNRLFFFTLSSHLIPVQEGF